MHLLELLLAEERLPELSELCVLLLDLLSGVELRSLWWLLAALGPFWAARACSWAASWAAGRLGAVASKPVLSAADRVTCCGPAAAADSTPLASQGGVRENANLPLSEGGAADEPAGFWAGTRLGDSCPAALGHRLDMRRWMPATRDGLPFTTLRAFLHSSPRHLPPTSQLI